MWRCPSFEQKYKLPLLTFALAFLGFILVLCPLCPSSAVAKEKPQITDVQKAIVNALVRDDYEILSTSLNIEGSKLGEEIAHEYKGLSAVSISELENAYRKSESQAEQKYLGKWILTSGTVSSFERNPPKIILKGAQSPSTNVTATLKQTKNLNQAFTHVKSGKNVELICLGGLLGNGPTLHNCEVLQEVAEPLQDDFRAQLLNALQGKGNLEENAIWVFTILKIEELLGEKGEQACLQSTADCLKEIILLRNEELPKGIPQAYLDLGYTPQMIERE